jgi:hypothetical protein
MKLLITCCCALLAGCASAPDKPEVRAGSALPTLAHADESVMSIEMVSYAGLDTSKKGSRLFIFNGQAFRSIEELKQELIRFASDPKTEIVMHGVDVRPGPEITQEEIDDLTSTCKKAGVWFTFQPGG